MKTAEKLRVEFKEEIGMSNWDFTILNKYSEWLEEKLIASQPAVSEENIYDAVISELDANTMKENEIRLKDALKSIEHVRTQYWCLSEDEQWVSLRWVELKKALEIASGCKVQKTY